MPPCHPWAIPEIQDGVKDGSLSMFFCNIGHYYDLVMGKINTQSLFNHLNIPNMMFSHLLSHCDFQMASKMATLMLIMTPLPPCFFHKLPYLLILLNCKNQILGNNG